MDHKPFRILLDVTDLYLQNFKYLWINISPNELRAISDLKKYALHKINLDQEDVQLFLRDGLLLDEETIAVLREDDKVKIKYKNPLFSIKDSVKEIANFSQKRNISESFDSDENTSSKRHKPEVLTLSSTRNECNFDIKSSKKRKIKKQTESPINFENCYFTLVGKEKEISINSDNICSNSKEKRKKQIQTDSSINFEECHSSVTEENNPIKKKHKKRDKKKSSVTLDETGINDNFFNNTDSFDSIAPQKQNKSHTSSEINLPVSENVIVLNNHSQSKESTLDKNESLEVVGSDVISVGLNNKKRKRKRKRRRKNKQSTSFDISDSCGAVDNFKSFSENVDDSIRKNQERNCFDDTSKLQNHFTHTFLKEDLSTDIQQMDTPKMSTPAQSDNCSIPNWQLSLMPDKNINLSYTENDSELNEKSSRKNSTQNKENKSGEQVYKDLPDLTSLPIVGTHLAYRNLSYTENDSELNEKSTRKNSTTQNKENKSGEQVYKDLPDLTSLPIVGTHLAYRALELDENYTPTATDYREGIVEKVNPKTEEIEIRLKREIILPAKSGRFENLLKDEIPEPTIKKYDFLKWCNMISPKILNCVSE